MNLQRWMSGVYSEVEFWRVWIRSRGALWPAEFGRRQRPTEEIDELAARLLPERSAAQIRVLDVGSGPLSVLGTHRHGERLDIHGADPLAGVYETMCRRQGIEPPVPVELAFAEDLSVFYPRHHFDLVVCQNALDHAFDPWRGLRQMLEVTVPGGHVLLRHGRNEAEHESYSGLHQWNLDSSDDGRFAIWNPQQRIDVSDKLAGIAEVRVEPSDPGHIVVVLRKTTDRPLFAAEDDRARLRELLESVADAATSLGREGRLMRTCWALETYAGYFAKQLRHLLPGGKRSSGRQ